MTDRSDSGNCNQSNNKELHSVEQTKDFSKYNLLKRKRVIKAIILLFTMISILIYFALVVLAASTRSTNYLRMTPKPGYSRPEVSNECRKILTDASLMPHGNVRPAEFREYGNLWMLDSAKTLIYKSSIMEHPDCLNVLLKRMVITNMRYILVVYDCEKRSEILIINNYKY